MQAQSSAKARQAKSKRKTENRYRYRYVIKVMNTNREGEQGQVFWFVIRNQRLSQAFSLAANTNNNNYYCTLI
jgi:hypothetical protein